MERIITLKEDWIASGLYFTIQVLAYFYIKDFDVLGPYSIYYPFISGYIVIVVATILMVWREYTKIKRIHDYNLKYVYASKLYNRSLPFTIVGLCHMIYFYLIYTKKLDLTLFLLLFLAPFILTQRIMDVLEGEDFLIIEGLKFYYSSIDSFEGDELFNIKIVVESKEYYFSYISEKKFNTVMAFLGDHCGRRDKERDNEETRA